VFPPTCRPGSSPELLRRYAIVIPYTFDLFEAAPESKGALRDSPRRRELIARACTALAARRGDEFRDGAKATL
jgi:hypothetical protein